MIHSQSELEATTASFETVEYLSHSAPELAARVYPINLPTSPDNRLHWFNNLLNSVVYSNHLVWSIVLTAITAVVSGLSNIFNSKNLSGQLDLASSKVAAAKDRIKSELPKYSRTFSHLGQNSMLLMHAPATQASRKSKKVVLAAKSTSNHLERKAGLSVLQVGRKPHVLNTLHKFRFLYAPALGLKNLVYRILLSRVLAVLLVLSMLIGIGYYFIDDLYLNTNFNYDINLTQNTVILARDGTELFKVYGNNGKRKEIALIDLPLHVRLAVVSIEDQYYYQSENGVSWYNLVGAYYKCLASQGDECRGASGISQQLVRNLTGDDSRDSGEVVQRKSREIVRAIKLNQDKDKDWILEKYLNTVYFGRNAYGIQEASRAYFDRDAKDLDPNQACYLAGLIQSPSVYSEAVTNPLSEVRETVEARKNLCLENMSTKPLLGPATEPILPTAEAKDMKVRDIKSSGFINEKSIYKYPHFVEFTKRELLNLLAKRIIKADPSISADKAQESAEEELNTAGYTVYTTLDSKLQDKVQNLIQEKAKTAIFDRGANNASAVVLDGPSGQILSMIGSIGYDDQYIKDKYGLNDEQIAKIDGKVNVALTSQQPGSSFKPYVYAAAFEKGKFNPSTMVMDTDTTFNNYPPYTPGNYTGRFGGAVSLKDALARSLNLPAIKSVYLAAGSDSVKSRNMDQIKDDGVKNVVELTQRLGAQFQVPDPKKCGVQLALGGCDITLLSHAEAMNTLSQLGDRVPVSPFIKICDRSGRDIYNGTKCDGSPLEGVPSLKNEYYKKQDKVLDPKIARQIVDMMSDVKARIPIFGQGAYKLTIPDRVTAAKTGTSNDIRDVWTVGFTPDRTAVVWVGNTDNTRTSENNTSVNSAATLWQGIMQISVEGTPIKDFAGHESLGMELINVNQSTGLPLSTDLGTFGVPQWVSGEQKQAIQDGLSYRSSRVSRGTLNLGNEDIFKLRTTVLFGADRSLCPVSEFQWAKFGGIFNWQEGVRKQYGGVCGSIYPKREAPPQSSASPPPPVPNP